MLVNRYQPVLIGVARRLGLGDADAADAAQQTLLDMVKEMRAGGFDRARGGGLRRWTLGILRHRVTDVVRSRLRSDGRMGESVDPVAERPVGEVDLNSAWEAEFNQCVVTTALDQLRTSTQMAKNTLLAFELTVIREVPVAAAAVECCMTADEVYVARNRVSNRLRNMVSEIRRAYLDDES